MQHRQFNTPYSSVTLPAIDAINTPLVKNNEWRLDELNLRISSRIYPDVVIPSSIDPRAIETRQTVLGKSTDPRNLLKPIDIVQYPVANSSVSDNFIPGDKGEPNWFLSNIDTETILRNQCFALQKGGVAPQATYMPSSNSELYRTTLPFNTRPVEQPFPLLFEKTQFRRNQRVPAKGGVDERNNYIAGTYQRELYRGKMGIGHHIDDDRIFYNIDRASLSRPFNG
jgi:hypothetical protein